MVLTQSPRGGERRHSFVDETLAKDRLGSVGVSQFVLTSAAPLLVVAGIVTTAWAVTGVVATPAAFLPMAVLLAVFGFGYTAMSRRVPNAGALYSFCAHGLGRPVGVAVGLLTLVVYNLLQVGLYGIFGVVASGMLDQNLGLDVGWWACALVMWAATALMGRRRVDLNGRVLAVLLAGELAFVLLASLVGLLHPADGHVSLAALNPANLLGAGGAIAGTALAVVGLAFVGFEQAPVYVEESRNPARTIPWALFGSLGLMLFVYGLGSWAMSVAVGPAHIVEQAQAQSVELLFTVAAPLGSAVLFIGHLLFLTSLFAASLAFHNTTNRYTFALGREGVLPRALARTSPRTGAPAAASWLQTSIGFSAIALYTVMGWDPLVQMTFYLGGAGGVGVLLALAIAAVAILFYLPRRSPGGLWVTIIAPLLSAVGLLAVCVLCLSHYATLLGLPPSDPLTWIFPAAYGVILATGLAWGLIMRATRPSDYALIGHGATIAPATIATTIATSGAAR